MKVADAWELPETRERDMPDGTEYMARVKQGAESAAQAGADAPCGRSRAVFESPDGEYFAGRWNVHRPQAVRVTVDGDVYEGRVSNPGDALFAVMRVRENRGPSDSGEKRLVAFEPICGARHAKMTKVSE